MEQHPNYPSGGTLTRRACVRNHSDSDADIAVTWSVKLGRAKLSEDDASISVPAGQQKVLGIEVRLPGVTARQAGSVAVTVQGPEAKPTTEEQQFEVFPSPPADVKDPVAVYGPEAFVDRVRDVAPGAKPVADLAPSALADCRVLAIAPGAFMGGAAAAALEPFVREGGRVVVFAQQCAPTWAPATLPLVRQPGSAVFPRLAAHPVLKGLGAGNLHHWLDDGMLFAAAFAKPVRGSARAIVDAESSGAGPAPLVEVRWGKGLALFCQLAVAEKAGTDPAAALLLHNLLSYAATTSRDERPVALAAPYGSPLLSFVRRVRGRVEEVDLKTVRLGRYKTLIADARGPRDVPDDLPQFVLGGGTVVVHAAAPEVKPCLPEAVRQVLTLRPTSLRHPQLQLKNASRASLSGWCPSDLWWPDCSDAIVRYVVDVSQWGVDLVCEPKRTGPGAGRGAAGSPKAGVRKGWSTIQEPGAALVEIPLGRGRVIIDQVEWDAASPENVNALRLGAQLLDEVGVELNAPPAGSTVPIDLRSACNVALTDRGGGGNRGVWTGQGEQRDLRALPVGEQRLGGVPFTIIDERANEGRAAIVLWGGEKPSFPRSARGIPVGLSACRLYFLHACAGALDEPAPIARYLVRYSDGRREEIPVVFGRHVADWYRGPQVMTDADVAWAGPSGSRADAALYCAVWANPHPEKPIVSLDFVSEGARCVPALLAVTAELQ